MTIIAYMVFGWGLYGIQYIGGGEIPMVEYSSSTVALTVARSQCC